MGRKTPLQNKKDNSTLVDVSIIWREREIVKAAGIAFKSGLHSKTKKAEMQLNLLKSVSASFFIQLSWGFQFNLVLQSQ